MPPVSNVSSDIRHATIGDTHEGASVMSLEIHLCARCRTGVKARHYDATVRRPEYPHADGLGWAAISVIGLSGNYKQEYRAELCPTCHQEALDQFVLASVPEVDE